MQPYSSSIDTVGGSALRNASVAVKLNGVLATIYDLDGVEQANPMTTDSTGSFSFRASNGEYTLEISRVGIVPRTETVLLYDPADDESSTASLASEDDGKGAGLVGFLYSAVYAAGTLGKWLQDLATSAGASLIGFVQSGTGAVARTVQDKQRESVSVKDFGAIGDGVTDDTAAIQAAISWAMSAGEALHFPAGIYATSLPISAATPVALIGDPGARIKLTAAASYVVKLGGALESYRYQLENLILDGNGLAADGLMLQKVISSTFRDIRTTNVTRAGLYLAYAQLCLFDDYACSNNIEDFTTIPVNGILADTMSSSANTFVNPCIEHVSGAGIKGVALVNSLFLNGTSEGNAIGIEFGEASGGSLTAIGNTVFGMDLEVNSTADIVLNGTADANDFLSLKAGYMSPPVQMKDGASRNRFIGGITSGFDFQAWTSNNSVDSVSLLGGSASINSAGTNNTWSNVFNISTGASVADSAARPRQEVAVPSEITINAAITDFIVIQASSAAITIHAPTNPTDGQAIDISVWNITSGAIAVTWDAVFRIGGWVNPASGMNRGVRLRYNSNFGRWYVIGMSATDAAN